MVNAYQELADAFEAYDEALDDAFGEVTPLGIYTDDDDDDDEDGPYVGLDDEGYDVVEAPAAEGFSPYRPVAHHRTGHPRA